MSLTPGPAEPVEPAEPPEPAEPAEPPEPAEPFSAPARPELTGGRRIAVLVIHGFTGSPASVRPWAEHLAEQGYAVNVPLLPGHATTWQELNERRWEDWHGTVDRAFRLLRVTHDRVAVAGLSMGGALALSLAQLYPRGVAGVALVNPALASRRRDLKALPVLKRLVPSFPGIADDIKADGVREGGYTRTPLKALASFVAQWPGLTADLPNVTVPVLVFRSTEDHVVDDASLALLRAHLGSDDVTVVDLANSYHVATLDHDAPQIFDTTAKFVARVTARESDPT